MSALRDRILNSSLDELVEAAERGEIDPDELWLEVISSLDRSLAMLREMNEARSAAAEVFDLRELNRKQDRIDAMITRWRMELDAAGMLPPDGEPRLGKARAALGG